MAELVPVIDEARLKASISQMARTLSVEYADKPLVMVCILKGAFVFAADLIRQMQIPVEIDFIGISSYAGGMESSGKISLTKALGVEVADKNVLIVEDIVDTGLTLRWLIDYIESFHPASTAVCTLVDKPERRRTSVRVAHACHVVEEGFLVGYGLDYKEQYRQLPALYHLKTTA